MAEPETLANAGAVWVADDLALANLAAISSWSDRVGPFAAVNAVSAQQPSYLTAGVAGQPAASFDGIQQLLPYAGTVTTAASGTVWAVCQFNSFGGTAVNKALWSSADVPTNSHLIQGQVSLTTALCRVNATENAVTNTYAGGTTLVTGTPYFLEWGSTGTAYFLRVNGVLEALTNVSGTNNGLWFSGVTLRDNFVLGGIRRASDTGWFAGRMAALGVNIGPTGATDLNTLYSWANSKYGFSLPLTVPSTGGDTGAPRGLDRGLHRGMV